MNFWNCCRTCLSLESLNPIFVDAEAYQTYTDCIYATTGIKVEMNDALPQVMCAECIIFINKANKFRKQCVLSQDILLKRLKNKDYCIVKHEKLELKNENIFVSIDLNTHDDDTNKNVELNFKMNPFDYVNNLGIDKVEADDTENFDITECESDCQEKPLSIYFNSKKSSKKAHSLKRPKKVAQKRNRKSKKNVVNDDTVEREIQSMTGVHESGKKEIKSKKEDKVQENIQCEYCHKTLTSKLSLRNHYKIHTGFDVVCEHCGKKFITRRLLLMHCRAKHGYEKTDKCSYCDYRASNAEQVKIHERLHTGEKPYVCKECSAGFHRKSSYLQHVAIHLPEKTVQCDQCPARFKSLTLMRIHRNRHRQPQYTFRCGLCLGHFARRRNVIRHLQRIHALVEDENHVERVKIA